MESSSTTTGKRKRAHLACVACRTRKQRCNGSQPKCSFCRDQNLECSFKPASKKAEVSQLYVHNLLMRVDGLEKQLEEERSRTVTVTEAEIVALAQPPVGENIPSATPIERMTPHNHPLPRTPSVEFQPLSALALAASAASHSQRTLDESEWVGNDIEDEEATDQATYGSPDTHEPVGKSYLGEASTISFMRKLLGTDKQSRANRADMPREACGPGVFSSQIHTWPQRFLGDHLVDCYMEFCHPQYPFIHEVAFRRRYETIWTAKEPQDNIWAGTVNMVFALGCEFSPEMSSNMDQGFFRKVESLVSSEVLSSSTLETIQLLTLMGLYLQSAKSADHAWNVIGVAVRQSQSLGLHLNKTIQSSKTPLECEMRKRAWWACFVLDSVSCIQMGRPNMIYENLPSTDYPACVDDELILDVPISTSNTSDKTVYHRASSNGQPSQMAFFLATIELCRFMREVLKVYDNPTDQALILEIDRKMCEWMGSLPSHLRQDGDCPINPRLWRQKQVLTSRFLNLRILLHRPCVSQPISEREFTPFTSLKSTSMARMTSLRAGTCVELSIKLINHIAAFYTRGINSAWWYDLNYVFSAATVLVAHRNMGTIHDRNSQAIKVAIDVVRRMKLSGKALAANYLYLLENLQHQAFIPSTGSPHPFSAPAQDSQSDPQSFMSTDVDLDTLLESTAFPWNLGSEIIPFEDEFSDFLGQ